MTPTFATTASTLLRGLAELVPFAAWTVSRKVGDELLVLATHDREYGTVAGDAVPWAASLCARTLAGEAPEAAGDVATVPAFAQAAADLGLRIGAYVTVPLRSSSGELYGTLCGADPARRDGPLARELEHAHRAAEVLAVLLEQQLQLEGALLRSRDLQSAATLDALTGLGNRRHWEDVLDGVEAHCAAVGGRAAVIALDLDGLRDVNDDLGHPAGDTLLRSAAEVLRRELRADDVVARTGGDEFAVVLHDQGQDLAVLTGERLRAALEAVDVAVSVGVSARSPQTTLRQAWHAADAALRRDQRARRSGRVPAAAPVPPGREGPAGFTPDGGLTVLLGQARAALGMPVAFLSRLHEGQCTIQLVDSAGPVGLHAGDTQPSEHTYCSQILHGRLPAVVPDALADPVAAALPATTALGIGSYVGVPVVLPDGSVYGSLGAFAGEARDLDERDSAVLQLVAQTVGQQLAPALQQWQGHRAVQRRIDEVVGGARLTVALQPVVDARTGRTVAVEALSRFPAEHGRRPDQWFDDARSIGEAVRLELAAVSQALALLPLLPPGVDLTVNVSPDVLVGPDCLRLLRTAPLPRLVVELTEHAEVQDYETLVRVLAPLRRQGLRLAVDDAGAGYASMRHLLQLRPDVIKLDLSLVRDVDGDASRRALCAAVTTFAHQTGALVVAEGVETHGELRALQTLGVDLLQGYLLQRPAPLAELRLDHTATFGDERGGDASTVQARTIEEMRHAGHSAASIAARLNQLGWCRPDGVRWTQRTVSLHPVDDQPPVAGAAPVVVPRQPLTAPGGAARR